MESSFLDDTDVAGLTQAASARRQIVLILRANDGELHDVFGGPIVPGSDPSVNAKGSWYWKDGCVYVNHNGWKKVCDSKHMNVAIQASDGTIIRVGGPWVEASDPAVSPKGSWYWKTSSPGCVYVFHFSVWKKVCD